MTQLHPMTSAGDAGWVVRDKRAVWGWGRGLVVWRVRDMWKQISPGGPSSFLGKALAWGKVGEALDGG